MSSNNERSESYSKLSSMVQGKIFDILLSKITIKPGDYCLDIGCGTGNVTAIFVNKVGPSGQVVGVDQDGERIKIARKKHSYETMKFLEGKFHEVNLVKSSFDLVFSNIVYHWLNEYERRKTTEKAFSVLKPNGLFLLAIPEGHVENAKVMFPYFPNEKRKHILGIVSYPPEEYYKDLFTSAGFEMVSFESGITEAAFMTVQSYLEWMDISYDLKEEFKKVYYENEDKIKFPRYADGTICQKASIFFAVLRKPSAN